MAKLKDIVKSIEKLSTADLEALQAAIAVTIATRNNGCESIQLDPPEKIEL